MPGNFRFAGLTMEGPNGPPDSWHSYLSVARSLIRGLDCFPEESHPSNTAHIFLCCHISECVLKAFISYSYGNDTRLSEPNLRHNLTALWRLAAERGLGIDAEEPEWLEQLDFLHNRPFYIRYQKGIGNFAVPSPQPARSEIKRIFAIVSAAVPPDPVAPQ